MFTITKIAPNNFSHFDGFKEMNFSNWEINFNNTTNTIILQLRNGAPFPKREVLASEVIIKDGISGTPETFSTTEQIRTRLLALNYNPLQSSGSGGGAVDSVNGQTGVVVLDADDISETATRKWQSVNQDNFNDATSSIQTQLNSKENTANKVTTMTGNETSNVLFLTAKAVYDWCIGLLNLKENYAIASTGNTIQFDTKRIYNSIASPTTGTMTNDLSGAKLGVAQKIYYNHSTTNPFPAGWVRLGSKTYTPSALNIIYAEWVGSSRVEYWISQEA